jgi:hypothetical protein
MAWIKASWIPPLFAAFNAIAPNRSTGSDGTIGDTAHQGSASGHNPDDTPGSNPERTDADNIAEVRAADVTVTLNAPGVSMEQIVQRVLATPAERDRLIYIIFNRRIWRKSNGWKQESYSGSNPHTGHAHFSGDPASDTDSGEWNSIKGIKEEVDDVGELTGVQREQLNNLELLRQALQAGSSTVKQVFVWDSKGGHHEDQPLGIMNRLIAMEGKISEQAVATTALSAALEVIAKMIRAGGGNIDITAVTAHIDARVSEVKTAVETLQADLDASQAREVELRNALAAALDSDGK